MLKFQDDKEAPLLLLKSIFYKKIIQQTLSC